MVRISPGLAEEMLAKAAANEAPPSLPTRTGTPEDREEPPRAGTPAHLAKAMAARALALLEAA